MVHRPISGGVSASDFFSDDLLQDVLVQRQITAFQSDILFLKLAQPPNLAGTQITVLLLPDVERRFGLYSKAAAHIHHGRAGFCLPQSVSPAPQ